MTLNEAKKILALNLGDDSLILSHRITEWCGHGPELEEDIALSNIGLDLLGQCQSLLNYACELDGLNKNADDLAYQRLEREFTNVLLVEQPNGHYGDTIARQFIYDVFHYYLLERLANSNDEFFSAFAQKSIKEVAYHLRHSTDWILRMGDGTEISHQKIQTSFNQLWKYTGELFETNQAYNLLIANNIMPNISDIEAKWKQKVSAVLTEATLKMPESKWMATGGRNGIHTEHLGFILTDMQYLARAFPNAKWD